MVRERVICVVLAVAFGVGGCASQAVHEEDAVGHFQSSALSNPDPAPPSMTPPSEKPGQTPLIDEFQMRNKADYHFALGEALSLDGDTERAIEEFRLALIYDGTSALIHMRLSAEFVKIGLVSEAVEQARVAVEKEPNNKDARLLLGGLLSALRLYEGALAEYEEILRIDPSDENAPLYVGAIYAEQRDFGKAQTYFLRLAQRRDYPNRHLAQYYLGRAFLDMDAEDRDGKARQAFLAAVELKPSFEDATLALGQLYVQAKNEDKARALWSSYQKVHGPSARVAEVLAQIYVRKGDFRQAYREYEIMAARRPGDLTVQYRKALILIEEKRYAEARDLLHTILEEEPASDRVRFYLGAVYEELQEYENAIDTLLQLPISSTYYQDGMIHAAYLTKQLKRPDEALRIIAQGTAARPDLLPFYTFHASLLDEQKRYREALAVLEAAEKRFPDQPSLSFFIGSTHDQLGAREKAMTYMRGVLAIDDKHVQALNYLAYIYAEENIHLAEAEEMARKALRLQPNDGYILDTLGWVLYRQGQIQEAVKVLEEAYRIQSGESVIAEHLGDAYFSNQLFEKARQMYVRAVQIGSQNDSATESERQNLAKLQDKIAAIEQMGSRRGEGQRLPASQPGSRR